MKNVFVMSFVDNLEEVGKFDGFGFVCEIDDEVNGIWCCERHLGNLSDEDIVKYIVKVGNELEFFVDVDGECFDKKEIELIENKLNSLN
jgi:hypothetical protein